MRIVLAISSLGAGGAERVITLLADAFAARDHEVWLVTLAPCSQDFFIVNRRVRRLGLNLMAESAGLWAGLLSNIRRVRALRRVLATLEPAAVVSFVTSTNVLVLLASIGSSARVIVSERIDPAAHDAGKLWELLRRLFYRRADALVVQTQGIAAWFAARLGTQVPVIVIPNPVPPVDALAAGRVEPGAGFLLAAGRLAPQKGFDVLIRAFAAVAQRLPELRLLIAGEGAELERLRALAAEVGVPERVVFIGQVAHLAALMKSAVAFVLPSRYEGFPNVLVEALAVGAPCVASDCPGAVREILADGAYGILVPPGDSSALADAIARLVVDPQLRAQYSAAAAAAVQRYRLDQVMTRWEQVLATA
ncbi:MAG: glycosyltransferase family 4 protein [Gammaproteobacteria bacterium]|nr:glycosyltransferase family 4 protein [Gammaproteobacteria bacterium]